ncbi:MAG: hypothetical protein K2V38_04710, partial [Gemmataceae bacterium]|nr:hypothetical protein [Gemmataceae bacterium]
MNAPRSLLAVTVSCLAFAPVGCESLKNLRPTPKPTDEVSRKVTPEDLVKYLNEHADRLQALSAPQVSVTATDRNMA